MTSFTPNHNLPIPDDSDDPDGPGDIGALALATEDALDALIPNSGIQTNLDITAGTNWAVTVKQHVIDGRVMFVRIQFTYSGAQIDASDEGNISDVTIGTINDAAKRPAIDAYGTFRASLTSGAVQCSAAAGVIRITDMHSTSRIEPAHTVDVYFAWPLP